MVRVGAVRRFLQGLHPLVEDGLRLLFPPEPVCPHCGGPYGTPGFAVLCSPCYDKLAFHRPWRASSGAVAPLVSVTALGVYRGPLRQAIHRMKYRADRRLAQACGYLMGALALEEPAARRVEGIVPIPLHPERAWRRGFNQADLLARGVAVMLERSVWDRVLERHRATEQQARLDGSARHANVKGAFAVSNGNRVEGAHLLLIDDVVTTGATLKAAAEALVAAGAKEVHAVVLAAAGTDLPEGEWKGQGGDPSF